MPSPPSMVGRRSPAASAASATVRVALMVCCRERTGTRSRPNRELVSMAPRSSATSSTTTRDEATTGAVRSTAARSIRPSWGEKVRSWRSSATSRTSGSTWAPIRSRERAMTRSASRSSPTTGITLATAQPGPSVIRRAVRASSLSCARVTSADSTSPVASCWASSGAAEPARSRVMTARPSCQANRTSSSATTVPATSATQRRSTRVIHDLTGPPPRRPYDEAGPAPRRVGQARRRRTATAPPTTASASPSRSSHREAPPVLGRSPPNAESP